MCCGYAHGGGKQHWKKHEVPAPRERQRQRGAYTCAARVRGHLFARTHDPARSLLTHTHTPPHHTPHLCERLQDQIRTHVVGVILFLLVLVLVAPNEVRPHHGGVRRHRERADDDAGRDEVDEGAVGESCSSQCTALGRTCNAAAEERQNAVTTANMPDVNTALKTGGLAAGFACTAYSTSSTATRRTSPATATATPTPPPPPPAARRRQHSSASAAASTRATRRPQPCAPPPPPTATRRRGGTRRTSSASPPPRAAPRGGGTIAPPPRRACRARAARLVR